MPRRKRVIREKSKAGASGAEGRVPTLFRLLLVIGILVALVWGMMLAMVTYMKPQSRPITRDVTLPPRK